MNKKEFNKKLNLFINQALPFDPDGWDELNDAMEFNNPGYSPHDIESIILEIEGINDEKNWHWIVKIKDGGYAYACGGCDYTGWDCQSFLDWHPAETAFEAIQLADEQIRFEFEQMINSGTRVKN